MKLLLMEGITRDHVQDLAKCNKILDGLRERIGECKQLRSPRFTLKWIKIEDRTSMLKEKDVGQF